MWPRKTFANIEQRTQRAQRKSYERGSAFDAHELIAHQIVKSASRTTGVMLPYELASARQRQDPPLISVTTIPILGTTSPAGSAIRLLPACELSGKLEPSKAILTNS